MPENQTSGTVYRFGDLELLADERMLMRRGERIHLTPRVFHLLLILVENAGRLVTKETLLSDIWQDSFVEEGNLNSTVSRLRKALGEKPNENRFIETIPRVGYRFIAEVERVQDEKDDQFPVVQKIDPDEFVELETAERIDEPKVVALDDPNRRRRKHLLLTLVSAGILLGVIGIGWYTIRRSRGAVAPSSPKNVPVRLTFDESADDQRATLTRDDRIRFERMQGKEPFTYVMNADGSDVQRETSIPGLRSGIWSADGKQVVYYKEGDTSGNLYLANADGSGESKLPFLVRNMDWSRDGKQIVYQYGRPDSDIYLYTFETGKIEKVVSDPSFDGDPSFSPDGKRIAFVSGRDGNAEIYSQNIDGSDLRRLTDHPARDAFPTYSPDGTQIVFNSNREDENLDVYIMNTDGSNVRRLTNWPSDEEAFPGAWSPDGTKLFFASTESGRSNICAINVEPFQVTQVNRDSNVNLHFPSYSRDGSNMLFQVASSDKTGEIQVIDTTTKQTSAIVKTATLDGYPKFSPDGNSIVFQDRVNGNSEICLIRADGKGEVQNLSNDPARDIEPAWSPDGNKIVFSSNRDGNYDVYQLYVMNADGSNQHRVYFSDAMSVDASWSADGREIIFTNDKEDGRTGNFEIFAIEPETTTAERRLTFRHGYDVLPAISPDGKHVAFVSKSDGNSEIYMMNSDGTATVRLTRDTADDTEPSWSPDGSKIIFASNRSGEYAIYEIAPF